MTGAQRAALMRDLINRRGATLVLQGNKNTLLARYPGATVAWTSSDNEVVVEGTPGAIERVIVKGIRLSERDLANALEETAIDGPPAQLGGWEITDADYPLFLGQEQFVHRGVLYTVLRIREVQDSDTLIKAVLITDYEA